MAHHYGVSQLHSITKLTWLLVLTLVIWQRFTQGMPPFEQSLDCGPNVLEYYGNCAHGELKFNLNSTICNDRIVCYSNLGEPCANYGGISNCLPGLVCSCYRCREVLTICSHSIRSPFLMAKRMQQIYGEYGYYNEFLIKLREQRILQEQYKILEKMHSISMEM